MKHTEINKGQDLQINDYMKLPYSKIIKEMNDETGHYFYGYFLELDGCQSTGDTLEELNENLNEALEGYLEVKLENNIPIPLPINADDFSGKFIIRVPKSLHQRLTIEAQQEGISLNGYAIYKLSR